MSLFDRYEREAFDLDLLRGTPRGGHAFVRAWEHPDFIDLMAGQQQQWGPRLRKIAASGAPIAGLGFTGPVLPNQEPVVAPAAVTGVTAETNLYTPATTTNADWALIPQGQIRAPQAWRIYAAGIYTSSATTQTCAFTSRIGTSGTPASNASLGATGAVSLGNATAVTNGLWVYEGHATVRSPGTSGTVVAHVTVDVSFNAAGSVINTNTGLSGNTTATVDTTLQQGFVISVTPSATGVSVQLTQFMLALWD